jgi:hypothetical protein
LIAVVAVALLVIGLAIAVRPTENNGADCGSVLAPSDVEFFGRAGTEPRPCRGSHDNDARLAVVWLTGAGIFGTGLAISSMVRTRKPSAEVASA